MFSWKNRYQMAECAGNRAFLGRRYEEKKSIVRIPGEGNRIAAYNKIESFLPGGIRSGIELIHMFNQG